MFCGILTALFFCCAVLATLIINADASAGPSSSNALVSYVLFTFVGAIVGFLSGVFIEKYRANRKNNDSDPLTGLPGPRFFPKILKTEWNRNLRSRQPLSLIIADLDDFASLKHPGGRDRTDHWVRAISGVFKKNMQRAGDVAAKNGNSQFIGLLPDTMAAEANFLAEKIREGARNLAMVHGRSTTGKIPTLSIGTATMIPSAQKDPADLIVLAEKAFSQAKSSGGNRVVSMDKKDE